MGSGGPRKTLRSLAKKLEVLLTEPRAHAEVAACENLDGSGFVLLSLLYQNQPGSSWPRDAHRIGRKGNKNVGWCALSAAQVPLYLARYPPDFVRQD